MPSEEWIWRFSFLITFWFMKLSELPESIRDNRFCPHSDTITVAWDRLLGQAAMVEKIVVKNNAPVVLLLNLWVLDRHSFAKQPFVPQLWHHWSCAGKTLLLCIGPWQEKHFFCAWSNVFVWSKAVLRSNCLFSWRAKQFHWWRRLASVPHGIAQLTILNYNLCRAS